MRTTKTSSAMNKMRPRIQISSNKNRKYEKIYKFKHEQCRYVTKYTKLRSNKDKTYSQQVKMQLQNRKLILV